MIPISIGTVKCSLPQSWQEVTLGQYIEMAKHSDDLSILRLLSILSGVDYLIVSNVNAETFDDRIIDHMGFIQQPVNVHELPPADSISINGKTYKLPDPGKCTIGQKLALQSQIRIGQDMNTIHAELVATAIAIYMQPILDNAPFNDERIEDVVTEVKGLPLVVAYPAGSFFLSGWVKFLRLSGSTYSPPTSPMKRSGPVLPAYSLNIMSGILLSSFLAAILQGLIRC